jgi:RNA-binding protein YlmH
MQDTDQLLNKRFLELSHRAFSRQCYTSTEFLTLAEQDILCRTAFDSGSAAYSMTGGYEAAERKIAVFGDESLCGYTETPPIICIRITPVSQKFADELTHRDFLGALMGLGVKRSVLGDILIKENCGYLFCLETIAGFITEQFTQVKRTTVKCAVTELPPEIASPELTESMVNVASERLDAIVAAVFRFSRGDSQELFTQGKVFVNSRVTENTSLQPETGDIVSVRGYGRFIYDGIQRETRKGRLAVVVRVY